LKEGKKNFFILYIVLGGIIILEMVGVLSYFDILDLYGIGIYEFYDKLIIDVIILLFIENIYRNTLKEQQWGIKYFCIALGILYTYDFLLYADVILFKTQALAPTLYEMRGIINILVLPLFAISISRNPIWRLKLQISQKAVFHSFSLVGMGAYLIGMSAAGYFLKDYGGEWGGVLQGTFILAALIVLIFFISSGFGQGTLKVLLKKHIFKYRYDYREEWLRLIATISNIQHYSDLQVRSIQSVADIIDCPSGALWLLDQPDTYSPIATWNMKIGDGNNFLKSDALMQYLEKENYIIDLTELTEEKLPNSDIIIPEWILNHKELWLIIPLIHHDKMIGFMMITKARARFKLEWETRDILKTAARQVASYLAEQSSQKELSVAKEFEAFNRQFAFVVHDIKNLTSQLSMLSKNAKKHADNPEFQKDMLLTVRNSVDKMESLLTRISVVQEPAKPNLQKREVIEFVSFLQDIAEKYRRTYNGVAFLCRERKLYVEAVADELDTILMHIIQNAIESCETKGQKSLKDDIDEKKIKTFVNIDLILSKEDEYAIIKIKDAGEGMTQEFIRSELFRPFRSTKEKGYGIGAYEAREMLRKLGGRLEVISKPDEGTVMTIYLKIAADQVREGR
jgi:putative PEP-CTERM system histidine kinase